MEKNIFKNIKKMIDKIALKLYYRAINSNDYHY